MFSFSNLYPGPEEPVY